MPLSDSSPAGRVMTTTVPLPPRQLRPRSAPDAQSVMISRIDADVTDYSSLACSTKLKIDARYRRNRYHTEVVPSARINTPYLLVNTP